VSVVVAFRAGLGKRDGHADDGDPPQSAYAASWDGGVTLG